MALGAVRALEDCTASDSCRCERTAGGTIGAGHRLGERSDVRRERVEIRAHARLRIAKRLTARTGVESRVRHQTSATGKRTNLAFEVLHLVEVRRPVPASVTCAAATQRDRAA